MRSPRLTFPAGRAYRTSFTIVGKPEVIQETGVDEVSRIGIAKSASIY
jgi:hypothetical protein